MQNKILFLDEERFSKQITKTERGRNIATLNVIKYSLEQMWDHTKSCKVY